MLFSRRGITNDMAIYIKLADAEFIESEFMYYQVSQIVSYQGFAEWYNLAQEEKLKLKR